ncbi:TetR/AcrR family transcriptional regulator [Paenibacillus sp. P26]|nr:TetR/AcrR family transcriptional regulator [Paenibacillus sp. P26]
MNQTVSTGDKLILAAIDLIAEQGYDGTTTKEIASAAGVSEVTLFRHFGSKQARAHRRVRTVPLRRRYDEAVQRAADVGRADGPAVDRTDVSYDHEPEPEAAGYRA